MSRVEIRRLSVTGPEKPPAELEFGPSLTLISGLSNTGKTHVLECLDFALGAGSPPRAVPEGAGYTDVAVELSAGGEPLTIVRRLPAPDSAVLYEGSLSGWDGTSGRVVKVDIAGAPDPDDTLSGVLLRKSGFDPATPIVRNERGKTQRLSFRTVVPFAMVREPEVISMNSPVAPPGPGGPTAPRSVFRLILTGDAPTLDEVTRYQRSHAARESAKNEIAVLDEMLAELREEIQGANLRRKDLEAELSRIDEELATVADAVSESGDRVQGLLEARNESLEEAETARQDASRAEALTERFRLLAEHYQSDVQRLEFVLEGGHFFQQIATAYCPSCGRPFDAVDDVCHPEAENFAEVEKAARAEIGKLKLRMADLETAILENQRSGLAASDRERAARQRASRIDNEIRQVANPAAASARARVRELGTRRREVESHLLRFRELERYILRRHEADARSKRKVDRYRPEHAPASLVSLAAHIQALLQSWHFPGADDLYFSLDADDLVIDGKERSANGKGVRAVTRAAFTIGLLTHCLSEDTPHPGFTVIDTPLTPFKGPTDDIEDPKLSRNVHTAFLFSLATLGPQGGQNIVIENIDPPTALEADATVHWFGGPDAEGRQGFYPPA